MLADKTYVPLLKTKIAEIEAYRQLSQSAKERIFPIFLLRPWPNANHISLAVQRLKEATAGYPFGLALDYDRRGSPSTKAAQTEFADLFDANMGYRTYFEFLNEIDSAIPVLQPSADANNLLLQIGNANDLDRGLVIHQKRGALIPLSEAIIGLPPLPNDTVFAVDAGWSRDIAQMQAWVAPIVDRIVRALPESEIAIISSSFPDSFAHIIGDNEEIAHEPHLFNSLKQRFQQADLTYGDWGSTRLPQQGGGGIIPSRIDIPRLASWQIFRANPQEDKGFATLAELVSSHGCFDDVPDCWGKRQVIATDGRGSGITGTKMNTSARINMHMTIKSGAANTIDLDEKPYID